MVKTTPVKDQGPSALCWVYAMLATIESEHLMMGDSVNLSTDYIARALLEEQAMNYFLSQGHHPINLRGTTIVVATHAKDIVDKMKKRVIQIDKGNIIRDDKKGGYDSEI